MALTGGDILGTALGFNPTRVSEMHEGQAAIKGREQKLMGRREEIVNMWMSAVQAGDQAMVTEAMQVRCGSVRPIPAWRSSRIRYGIASRPRSGIRLKFAMRSICRSAGRIFGRRGDSRTWNEKKPGVIPAL